MTSRSAATSGCVLQRSSASGSLRRQFGCSATVPGRFAWSSSSNTSSGCSIASFDGVRAMNACAERAERSRPSRKAFASFLFGFPGRHLPSEIDAQAQALPQLQIMRFQ